jgi:hypothetical protein
MPLVPRVGLSALAFPPTFHFGLRQCLNPSCNGSLQLVNIYTTEVNFGDGCVIVFRAFVNFQKFQT